MTQFPFNYEERSREHPTSESYDLENGTIEAVRVFEGPWRLRQNFIFQHILKPMRQVQGVTLLPGPQAYPEANIAFARKVSLVGRGKSGNAGANGMASWERALITVHYGTKPYGFNELGGDNNQDTENYQQGLYIDESIDGSVEFLNIPKNEIFDADGIRIGGVEDHNITIVYLDIILSQINIIRPNWSIISQALGKVNSEIFITPSGFIAEKETLRYDAPFGDTRVNIKNGSGLLKDRAFPLPVWQLEHRFKYNLNGWNKILKDGEFVDVFLDAAAAKPLFRKTDLNKIFFGGNGAKYDQDLMDLLDLELTQRDNAQADIDSGIEGDALADAEARLAEAEIGTEQTLKDIGFRR